MSSFTFEITSRYAPYKYTQESICPLAYEDFTELARTHFSSTPPLPSYFVALMEDQSKNSALMDLELSKKLFTLVSGPQGTFVNPRSKSVCERVSILGIDKLGTVSVYATCTSMEKFQQFSVVSALRSLYLLESGEENRKASSLYQSILKDLPDAEAFAWLKLIWKDEAMAKLCLGWYADAIEFIGRGSQERSLEILEKLEKELGTNPDVQGVLGFIYSTKKGMLKYIYFNPGRAAYYMEKLISVYLNERSVCDLLSNYLSLGSMYEELGDYEKAAAQCMEVIRKGASPYLASAYKRLGGVFLKEGRHFEALESLQKAHVHFLEYDEDIETSILLGETYKLMGDFEEAEKRLMSVLDNRRYLSSLFDARCLAHLAEIQRIRGNFLKAHTHLNAATLKLLSKSVCIEADRSLIDRQRELLDAAEKLK